MPETPSRSPLRPAILAAAFLTWTVWCLLSVAPASLATTAVASAAGRPGLAANLWLGIAIELIVLAVSAWIAFALIRRLEPPAGFWLWAPAGYLLAFVLETSIVALLGAGAPAMDAATALRLAAGAGVVAAGGYVGGVLSPRRRDRAERTG
jgi:hypothetical protein